jgi:hypothetical protein
MVVVVMEPGSERLSTLVLGLIAAGVGPSVGHGAVEPLDLAVGLRTVRAGPLRLDGKAFASIPPQVRPIRAAVVRENSLDGDAAIRKPLDGAVQDAGGGGWRSRRRGSLRRRRGSGRR